MDRARATTALAAFLCLWNLGNEDLWQDEAQTAVIARTILDSGIPLGSDGVNSFSQEAGLEFGEDLVWKWHTWLSFSLVAGSFEVFGESTFSARLPSALLGIAVVILMYFTARRIWRAPRRPARSSWRSSCPSCCSCATAAGTRPERSSRCSRSTPTPGC